MANDIAKLRIQWAGCSLAELRNIYQILDKDQNPATEQALLEAIQQRQKELDAGHSEAIRLESNSQDLKDKPPTSLMIWTMRLLGLLILAWVFFMTVEVNPGSDQNSFPFVATWGSSGIMLILASIVGEWETESADQFIERIYMLNPGKAFVQLLVRGLVVIGILVCGLLMILGLIVFYLDG